MEKKKLLFGNRQIEILERFNYLNKKISRRGLTLAEAKERDKLEEIVINMLDLFKHS